MGRRRFLTHWIRFSVFGSQRRWGGVGKVPADRATTPPESGGPCITPATRAKHGRGAETRMKEASGSRKVATSSLPTKIRMPRHSYFSASPSPSRSDQAGLPVQELTQVGRVSHIGSQERSNIAQARLIRYDDRTSVERDPSWPAQLARRQRAISDIYTAS